MFWPRMATDLKTYISKCDVCLAHRAAPPKETLLPHEFTPRPWSKVGANLCELNGRTLLVVCDYYSNFIEVENLQTTTNRAVCKALKILFARYGVPDTLVTDNSLHLSFSCSQRLGVSSTHVIIALSTVQWQGRERRQDSEATLHKVQGGQAV